jgi:hypothetical protein
MWRRNIRLHHFLCVRLKELMVITLYSGIGCNCVERQGKPSLCPSECQQLSIVGSSIQKRVKMDYYERTW